MALNALLGMLLHSFIVLGKFAFHRDNGDGSSQLTASVLSPQYLQVPILNLPCGVPNTQ